MKLRILQPPTARFWVWWNDGWCKLSVRPGESMIAVRCARTDDGWSSRIETYSYPEGSDRVQSVCLSEGRDCDGRLSQNWEGYCLLTELSAVPCYSSPPRHPVCVMTPHWRRFGENQRDYSAESMGY